MCAAFTGRSHDARPVPRAMTELNVNAFGMYLVLATCLIRE